MIAGAIAVLLASARVIARYCLVACEACDQAVKRAHMELAEWLVHWAPKLASRVRCSTRSSP